MIVLIVESLGYSRRYKLSSLYLVSIILSALQGSYSPLGTLLPKPPTNTQTNERRRWCLFLIDHPLFSGVTNPSHLLLMTFNFFVYLKKYTPQYKAILRGLETHKIGGGRLKIDISAVSHKLFGLYV